MPHIKDSKDSKQIAEKPKEQKNPQSFEEYYNMYKDDIARVALYYTKNKDDAEDLVQNTLLKAYKHFSKFNKKTNFKSWIFKIIENTYLTQIKHKNEQNILGLNQNFDIVDDKETSTEEQIVNKETVSEIREQISKLPKKYQEVVMLADIKGLDCKEIADLLNIPIGTVKSRLHRGQAMLQERMQNKNNRSIK